MNQNENQSAACPCATAINLLADLFGNYRSIRDERDELRKQLENTQKACKALDGSVGSMAYCIRDGIELNYDTWDEWQSAARLTLRENAADVAKGLDSYREVKQLTDAVNSYQKAQGGVK